MSEVAPSGSDAQLSDSPEQCVKLGKTTLAASLPRRSRKIVVGLLDDTLISALPLALLEITMTDHWRTPRTTCSARRLSFVPKAKSPSAEYRRLKRPATGSFGDRRLRCSPDPGRSVPDGRHSQDRVHQALAVVGRVDWLTVTSTSRPSASETGDRVVGESRSSTSRPRWRLYDLVVDTTSRSSTNGCQIARHLRASTA